MTHSDSEIQIFFVGGAVRDLVLGLTPKDYDLVAVYKKLPVGVGSQDLFDHLKSSLENRGLSVVHTDEEKKVYRTRTPYNLYVDVKYCPISIQNDLGQRDFTINAMALQENSSILIDPFNGLESITSKTLKPVSMNVFIQDPVRLLRALRFSIQLNYKLGETIQANLRNPQVVSLLLNPSYRSRIREELNKMFALDVQQTLTLLQYYPLLISTLFSSNFIKLKAHESSQSYNLPTI